MTAMSGEPAAVLCRARRPGAPCRNTKVKPPRPANSQLPHCRERACPFRAAHGPTLESPGECAARLRIRPRSADIGAFPAGRGKPLPYRGSACGFALSCGKRGTCCAARRVGAPYRVNADSPYGLFRALCCCAERRGRRSLPHVREFAGGLLKTGMLLRGAPYMRRTMRSKGFKQNPTFPHFPLDKLGLVL